MRPAARFLSHGLAGLLAGLAATLRAQPAPAAEPALEPLVVTGSVAELRAFDAPYAIGTVDEEALRAGGWLVDLSESLAAVPGLSVLHRGNHAQDLQVSSRGFGARAGFGVRGLRLYTDGIPATMPDGSGQVSHFDLLGAQRVEVLRGPFSALYGHGSGGVIALVSAPVRERRAEAGVVIGSHGARQLRGRYEAPLDERWDLRATASAFETDGFRPHAGARRLLGNLRLGWHDGADRMVVHAHALHQKADDPLGLTRAQYEDDPGQTTPQALDFDTRKTTRQRQLGAQWRREHGGVLSETALTAYLGQREVQQWLAVPPAAQANPTHSGGVIDLDRRYHGLDARAVWRFASVRWVAGIAWEHQRDRRKGYENHAGSDAGQRLGVTGALRRNEVNAADTTDLYTQAEVDLGERVVATLGLRAGRLRQRSDDRFLANGDDSGHARFRYANPVAGLLWRATPQWNLYASVGRGFEAPTLNELAYRGDGSGGFNDTLDPQRSRQLELGAKWRAPDSAAGLDVALFRAETRDELAVRTNTGGRSSYANVGRTVRQGAELALHWRWQRTLQARLALTWLDATYRDAFLACDGAPCTEPTVPVAPGNRIAGTTPRSAWLELAWRPGNGHELAAEWRAQGRTAVDDVNSDFAAGYGVLALRSRVRLGGASGPELFARIDNLFDRRHVGSVIVNEGNRRYFEPGAPRRWTLGLSWPL
ncbi:TonB-dependent receptor family protein [Caldimonas thermodepolymerans]|uniref:TonB-dependent receptor family protein n=1 Tax=Caldimonas thermodepolymerans TaxID=215580 RepID=UPI002235D6BB|nr:TonB-dependent receptor [Caldimonas thermodepolymerans]UZG45371.1 TonB-dependent receptor [Caldimonas thermodepolymerans]